jgi:hypothetical protein
LKERGLSVFSSTDTVTVPSGIVPLPVQVCPGNGANSKM